jgi:Family of unknown function (DUF6459)
MPTSLSTSVPLAAVQAVLPLDFAPGPPIPVRPNLCLVTWTERELDAFATRFAQAVVEVIAGDRGVHQLMRWTTDEVYEELQVRSNALTRTTTSVRRRRLRAYVRSVHLSMPVPDGAELSIHVRHGDRSRAIAARIDRIEGRWRCSALQFG